MTKKQKVKIHGIIHGASASAAAIGGGLANIPGSDAPALLAVQTTMIVAIGTVCGVSISDSLAKSMIADFLGVSVGKTVANILTGWLPGIGNGVNAATAATLTETIGWAALKSFENGIDVVDSEGKERINFILQMLTSRNKTITTTTPDVIHIQSEIKSEGKKSKIKALLGKGNEQ